MDKAVGMVAGGLRATAISALVTQGGRLLLLLVLVRIVAPADFGLLSLTYVFVTFSSFFVDAGISNALFRTTDLPRPTRSALFWLNALLAGVLAGLLVLLSPLIAAYYATPALAMALQLAALGLVFTALGALHRVLLRRALQFKLLAIIEITAFMANALLTLWLAKWGYGVFALVAGTVLNNLLNTLGYLVFGRRDWWPTRHFRWAAVRPFLSFGLFQMGDRTVNYLAERIDVLIIGKVLGPAALGIYDVLKQILARPEAFFNPVVGQVALPVIAGREHDNNFVKTTYLTNVRLLNTLNFPIYIFAITAAKPLLIIGLGSAWAVQTMTFRWLAVFFLIHSTFNPIGTLVMARGRADLGFYWNLGLLPLLAATTYIGLRSGVAGVSVAMAAVFAALIGPFFYYFVRPLSGATIGEYMRTAWRPCWSAVLSATAALPILWIDASPVMLIGLSGLLFAGIYLSINWLTLQSDLFGRVK